MIKAKYMTLSLAVVALAASPSHADLKVKTSYDNGQSKTEMQILTRANRQRISPAPGIYILNQCDVQRTVQVLEAQRSFMVVPRGSTPSPMTAPAPAAPRKGGIANVTLQIEDTGETKNLFGRVARRVRSIMVRDGAPDSCQPGKQRIETDGWYIDFDGGALSCGENASAPPAQTSQSDCTDDVRMQQTGSGKLGYPLAYAMNTTAEDGKTVTMTMNVTEFSVDPLDPSLFEVPAGFSELKIPDTSSMMQGAPAVPQRAGLSAASAAAPKAPGAIRVGVPSTANKAGKGYGGLVARDRLMDELVEQNLDAVPLDGLSDADLQASAQKQQCDYILYTDITEVKQGGGGGFGKLGGMINKATAVAGGGSAKEKVEAKIDYKLLPVGASKPLASASSKGSNGGGFNWKGAMKLAASVGSMTMFMKGGFFDPRLMQAMGGNMGAMSGMPGVPGMPRGGFDPGLSGMFSTMQMVQNVVGQPQEPNEDGKAVADGLSDVAKMTAEVIRKKK